MNDYQSRITESQIANYAAQIRTLIDRNKELETKLLYAEDAASKGDLARQQAGGMELEIKELRERLDAAEKELEQTKIKT